MAKDSKNRPLNNRQRLFVDHYLQCWNASEAARRSGYKKNEYTHTHASKLLLNATIRAHIDQRLKEMQLTADEVLARLSAHARGDLSPFVDGDGRFDLSTNQAKESLFLVKKYRLRERHGSNDKNEDWEQTEIEIELHDPQAALVHIGRHHKLFTDRVSSAPAWEEDLVDLVKGGKATLEDVAREFGPDIAARIAARLGVLPSQS